eukprot:4746699-Alexandrium_andersonii.AAC.1
MGFVDPYALDSCGHPARVVVWGTPPEPCARRRDPSLRSTSSLAMSSQTGPARCRWGLCRTTAPSSPSSLSGRACGGPS